MLDSQSRRYARVHASCTCISHFPLHLDGAPRACLFLLSPLLSLSLLPLFIFPRFFIARRTINPRPINQRPFLRQELFDKAIGNCLVNGGVVDGKRRGTPKNHEVRAFCRAAYSHSIHIPNERPAACARAANFIYRRIPRNFAPASGIRPRLIVARNFHHPINRVTIHNTGCGGGFNYRLTSAFAWIYHCGFAGVWNIRELRLYSCAQKVCIYEPKLGQ